MIPHQPMIFSERCMIGLQLTILAMWHKREKKTLAAWLELCLEDDNLRVYGGKDTKNEIDFNIAKYGKDEVLACLALHPCFQEN